MNFSTVHVVAVVAVAVAVVVPYLVGNEFDSLSAPVWIHSSNKKKETNFS